MTWELFSGQGGNLMAEMEIDRLWGIPGGFLDLVAVIIGIAGITAGCWRGCLKIGQAVRDESRS